MDNFGDQLRQERERRNVALDEIARSTKIRVRYLQALEDGEHERLPGIVFAKGYVRAYAETIGADAERLVGAYVAEQRSLGRLQTEASQENVLEALAAAVENDKNRASKRAKAALIVIVAVAGFVAFWFGVRPLIGRDPATVATTSTPKTAAPEQASVPETTTGSTRQAVDPANEPVRAVEPTVVDVAQARPIPREVIEVTVQPKSAPAPAVVNAQTDATTHAPASLSVSEFGVGTGVRQRVLVGEASEFETGTMVVFWNRVLGGGPGRHIRHIWFHEGNVNGSRELSIGAAHWRTYSKQTLRRDGTWTVEAQDEQGRVLARETFVATSRKL